MMTLSKDSRIEGFKDSSGRAGASSLEPSHPQPLESLLPGLPKSAAPPKKRRYAASWPDEACDFADRLIAEWNSAFNDHGTRANHTHHNHFVGVQLWRWVTSANNDGEQMTLQDVIEAIKLYARDPHNSTKCAGRWKCFADWVATCPDAVDHQLARVGRRRGAKAVAQATAAGRAAAERLLGEMALNYVVQQASGLHETLRDYVSGTLATMSRSKRPDPRTLRWYQDIAAALAQFDAQPNEDQKRFEARAKKGFAALRGREPGREMIDANTVAALALALFLQGLRVQGSQGPSDSSRGSDAAILVPTARASPMLCAK